MLQGMYLIYSGPNPHPGWDYRAQLRLGQRLLRAARARPNPPNPVTALAVGLGIESKQARNNAVICLPETQEKLKNVGRERERDTERDEKRMWLDLNQIWACPPHPAGEQHQVFTEAYNVRQAS